MLQFPWMVQMQKYVCSSCKTRKYGLLICLHPSFFLLVFFILLFCLILIKYHVRDSLEELLSSKFRTYFVTRIGEEISGAVY
jgi:hypothetical protein